MLKIKHVANHATEYYNLFLDFHENGGTLKKFVERIEKLSEEIRFYNEDERNKFKGDSLEILAEIFFMNFASDEAVGLRDYAPVPLDEDYGVDATGINANGHRSVVQVKYRANPLEMITYEDIAKTAINGIYNFQLDKDQIHNIFIFTTSNHLSVQCKTFFGERLVFINREIIRNKIDNNANFWDFAFKEIFQYLDQ